AELLELFADFFVVVDLAVENDPGSAVLIGNRLLAGLEVDDRKAAHRHPDMVANVEAVLIRPAMADGIIHPLEQRPVHRLPITTNHSCYATHYKLFRNREMRISIRL